MTSCFLNNRTKSSVQKSANWGTLYSNERHKTGIFFTKQLVSYLAKKNCLPISQTQYYFDIQGLSAPAQWVLCTRPLGWRGGGLGRDLRLTPSPLPLPHTHNKTYYPKFLNTLKNTLITLISDCQIPPTMFQRKVDVDMLNAVRSVLADVSSVSPSSFVSQHTFYGVQHIHINLTLHCDL